jgi:hypothetical protein
LQPAVGYEKLDSRNPLVPQKRLFSQINSQVTVIWHLSDKVYLEELFQKSRFAAPGDTLVLSSPTISTGTLWSSLLNYQTNWDTRFYIGWRQGLDQFQQATQSTNHQREIFAKFVYSFSR